MRQVPFYVVRRLALGHAAPRTPAVCFDLPRLNLSYHIRQCDTRVLESHGPQQVL